LLWTYNSESHLCEAVLIDPAAHGGHRETDLAMLGLFGTPYLHEILEGYQAVTPLAEGWEGRVKLHQLYPVAAHAVLFGGPYLEQTRSILRYYGSAH
jgi:fructosamine-3-kinase